MHTSITLKQLVLKHISEQVWYHNRNNKFSKQMLHDIPLHWLLWCIWSVYPAGHNPSERRCGVKQVRWERKRNREERVNRKLQSLEGQQDVPYLEVALIKVLGWGNVITSGGGEWTEKEIKWDKKWWMQWETARKRVRICYIISSFSCFCCPLNEIGLVLWNLTHLFAHNISDPQYHWWKTRCLWDILIWSQITHVIS